MVTKKHESGAFTIARGGYSAPIFVDANDWKGVVRAARDLRDDIGRVTDHSARLGSGFPEKDCLPIVIGTLGKSPLIDSLIRRRKLNVKSIKGKWEATLTQVVKNPWPGVKQALVVAGSDKRGSIYGIYRISEEAGVSPWYWWADVPVKHSSNLFAKSGIYVQSSPAVKYRGIFINDEAPSLTNWVREKFGDYNHHFYAHVFELLLRLKANYLWPAMWNNCFDLDDPINPQMADEYGIVMGTSHVEPMTRADKEWSREGHPESSWNYQSHPKELNEFWSEGIKRNKPFENIVTIGMRGKVDTPMSERANIQLLESIVAAQREILARDLTPDVASVPQLWCLYKEVQEYYEKGMRVPDDVTLLWADDNWGNIRRLPTQEERGRSGGAGVYYHFDYVGGPRNYKWLNTVQIDRVWEQLHLVHESGANRIWIVNVGSLKEKEFPLDFFLSYAWDPDRWDASTLQDYTRQWASRQFGFKYAAEIADLIGHYTQYNARRKPELLDSATYSLINFNEADEVVDSYNRLAERAKQVEKKLPAAYRPAFYELIEHPILACANLNDLYVSAAKNQLYAAQGRASANYFADRVKRLFERDDELKKRFHTLLGGKWDHMMDQTHIGYTSWQQPDRNIMPVLASVTPARDPAFAVAVEGDARAYPVQGKEPELPLITSHGKAKRWLDIFQKGEIAAPYSVSADPWIQWVCEPVGGGDQRLWVEVDWPHAPLNAQIGTITITGSDGQKVTVKVPFRKDKGPLHGFVEDDGYVSIEAEHYQKAVNTGQSYWKNLPNLGRTLGAVTDFPATARAQNHLPDRMCLEYQVNLFSSGTFALDVYLSPTQKLWPAGGLRYGISIDDEAPQIVDIHKGYVYASKAWEESVANNILIRTTHHTIQGEGPHTIKFWAIDPGVVLQKLVLHSRELPASYLGPPESARLP